MKKAVLNFITIALISIVSISFNSCKKIRHRCVEFKRDYVDPALDDYFFAAFANDVDNLVKENGGQNHDEAATLEETPTYTTYSYYHADLNLRKIGYPKKNSQTEKEASTTFVNKDGKSKPGKGGFFDNPGAFNQTFTAVATGGGGGGASQVVFYAGSNTLYQRPIFVSLNGSQLLLSPNNPKMLYSDWSTSAPSCSTDEGCNQYALCSIIKADVTQAGVNNWSAIETNSIAPSRTWSGSFTKTAGCIIIEIK